MQVMKRMQVMKKRAVETVPFWWHSIDLGDGVITPGQTSVEIQSLREAAIPEPLEGKSVLDIGCWDGYFSFRCENKGATVYPVDNYQYREFVRVKYGVELKGGEGFLTCARILGSKLTIWECDFKNIDGAFDIVLFFGVLYHQKDPLTALEVLWRLTADSLVLETHYIPDEDEPLLRFYKGGALNNDPTNFWGPTLSCVEAMLSEVGFGEVQLLKRYWDQDNRAIYLARK